MSRHPRTRALRPRPEDLESRLLLSKVVSGVDADGDKWSLRLVGPGDLRVINQNDSSGNPIPLGTPAEIAEIDVAGPDPFATRLVGKVVRGTNGDGHVFFQDFKESGGRSEGANGNNGINAVDMPDFYLGQTAPSLAAGDTPRIYIPDGVNTLRFGGVDTTFTPPGGTSSVSDNQSNDFQVVLGLPRTWGTSIIINKSVSSAQAATTSTGSPTQNSVTFFVDGRLNLFQADEIDGNAAIPSSGFRGGGGTVVFSATDITQTIVNLNAPTQISGQIGYVRVGGNATNFAAQTNDRMANFYIGGETNNVLVLAPQGSRNLYFGKGMDNVTVMTHTVDTLQANRGAIGSNITSDRTIGRITMGGDVVNSTFLAGYEQNLGAIFTNQTAPTNAPAVEDGGAMQNVLVAGDVTDSIFAASVDPNAGLFSDPDALKLPHGHISAKVEGDVTTTDNGAESGFFAKSVKMAKGPINPPNVPESPFPNRGSSPVGPRVAKGLQPTIPFVPVGSAQKTAGTVTTQSAKSHPKGPSKK